MSDHSRHGAVRAAGEHLHDLDGAADHAGHGQGHEHLGHAGHADVYKRRFWITLILAVPVVVYSEMTRAGTPWLRHRKGAAEGRGTCRRFVTYRF